MFSRRAHSVDSSGIRKVFDLAAKLKDPVNLSIGQPDFDAFDAAKAGAIEAIQSGKNGYTVTQGIAPLRSALASKLGFTLDEQYSVFITSGVSGGLFLAYLTLLDPGDEVLIPDPFFVMYRDLASLVNAVPRYYETHPSFEVRAEELEKNYTPKVRAVVVASPGNPTGVSLDERALDAIVEFARSKDIWLIYDEIYEAFCFDRPHVKAFGKYEKTIVLNGFSKSHGVPGWRMGYAAGPTEAIQQMLKLQQYTFVCAPSVAQWGILAALDTDFSATRAEYRRKRDFLVEALGSKLSFVKPDGAFYLYPEAPGGSGQRFVERCIENNLLVVPGNVFSRRDSHFRISFSAPMSQLERGAEILCRLAT